MHSNRKMQQETLNQLALIVSEVFTHSQLTESFTQYKFTFLPKDVSKHNRVLDAFIRDYNKRFDNTRILNFLFHVINPARFDNQEEYDDLLYRINTALAHEGFNISFRNGERKVFKIEIAKDINDAKSKANELRALLESRHVHSYVIGFCRSEFLQDNYFHAVLEATKSVFDRIRSLSQLTTDGNLLIDTAFSTKNPILKINDLKTESEISEQNGFMNLMKGITSMFRNPTAHEAKIKWAITKDEATDLLSLVSFIHKKLDSVKRTSL